MTTTRNAYRLVSTTTPTKASHGHIDNETPRRQATGAPTMTMPCYHATSMTTVPKIRTEVLQQCRRQDVTPEGTSTMTITRHALYRG